MVQFTRRWPLRRSSTRSDVWPTGWIEHAYTSQHIFPQFFNFLAIFCAIFSEESISFSIPNTNLSSLFELDQPSDSPVVAVIVGIRLLDESQKEHYQNFSFPNFWPPFLFQFWIIFSELTFLLERMIQLSVPGTYGDFVCLSAFVQRLNLDLFSPLTRILQHSQQFRGPLPVSWCQRMSLQQNRNPLPVSWCYRMVRLNSTRLEQCLPPNAGCCLLLSVEEGQNPRKDDCHVILQVEAALFGRKVDRRVHTAAVDAELWLITCVWNRIGQMAREFIPERRSTGV